MFYSKIVIDISTSSIVEQIPFDYTGPIAELKGKQKSSTTVSIPPPTAEETQARAMQNFANRLALGESGYVVRTTPPPAGEPGWESIGSGTFARKKTTEEFTPEERQEQEVNRLYGAEALKRAQAGFGATPEEKTAIEKIFGTARTRGKESIRQFLSELSGARGFDVASATPLAREASRASQELEEGLGSAQAASEVDFGERARHFGQEMRAFQEGLRQRTFTNRLNIGGAYGNIAGELGGLRSMQTTTKQKSGGGRGLNIGGIFSGVGSLASAGASLGF
ncbi:MAG: hypothetical protein ACRD5H_01250 [Nitrososphaerales archaeon]